MIADMDQVGEEVRYICKMLPFKQQKANAKEIRGNWTWPNQGNRWSFGEECLEKNEETAANKTDMDTKEKFTQQSCK